MARLIHSTQDPNVGFVETLYQTCSTALVHLWRSRLRLTLLGPQRNTFKKDVANIRLWEENFPPGQLDVLLGQSGHLRTNVVENLKGVGNILMPYFAGCEGNTTNAQNERSPVRHLARELKTQLEKATLMLSDEDGSNSSSDDEASDDSSSTTEREQNRFGRLHCYISCLMDLAPVIEKHILFVQRQVEPESTLFENDFHISHNAQPFAMRIRDRFPSAPALLVKRLAEANWERSVRIGAQAEEEEEPSEEDHIANRDARTLLNPYSQIHDSGLVSSMRNRVDWKMHDFGNLQSYLCTHEECKDAPKTFPTRKLWEDHEFNKHFTQVQWRCFRCNTTTSTQESFVHHLITSHGDITLAGHRLTAAISEAEENNLIPNFKYHKCALCPQAGWQTWKEYTTHVGQHLEEISLACAPRNGGGSSDRDSTDDTSDNAIEVSVINPFGTGGPEPGMDPGHQDLSIPMLQSEFFEFGKSKETISAQLGVARPNSIPPGLPLQEFPKSLWSPVAEAKSMGQIYDVPPRDLIRSESLATSFNANEWMAEIDPVPLPPEPQNLSRDHSFGNRPLSISSAHRVPGPSVPGKHPEEIRNIDRTESWFRCLDCSFTSQSKSTLKRHVNDRHLHECEYFCPKAGCDYMKYRCDKILQHCNEHHHEAAAWDEIEVRKNPLPCPLSCPCCRLTTPGWKDFWQCYIEHCKEEPVPSMHLPPTLRGESSFSTPMATPRAIQPMIIEPTAIQPTAIQPTAKQPRAGRPGAIQHRYIQVPAMQAQPIQTEDDTECQIDSQPSTPAVTLDACQDFRIF
ncbi:uncharacterized protein N7482_010274 [Penicillium canariense]|uniref:C2H2-type domain-containing protein n=1 Tax=Penicillium canariense TaxID=189055 RepID=A0A9W9HKG6_9EURO|nr:uncharacterized protein N7482_010274 [Penicillium canariense]KAJ5151022.1 hypothetical protein N7482_010274 [Penicillium canariense]